MKIHRQKDIALNWRPGRYEVGEWRNNVWHIAYSTDSLIKAWIYKLFGKTLHEKCRMEARK